MATFTGRQPLKPAPRQFFMSLRDIGFWIRSAKADAALSRLEREHGLSKAFDLLYERNGDPWGYLVPHYRYQRLKYDKLLAMLPNRSYASALDIGCGIGVFSRMLSPYAGEVIGVELSAAAVRRAQELSREFPNVRYEQGCVSELARYSGQQFDLIVLADILYYLSPLSSEVLQPMIERLCDLLAPGGILLLANHFFFDLDPQSRKVRGIHAEFYQTDALACLYEERHPFFLAGALQKR